MLKKIEFRTEIDGFVDITEQVKEAVKDSKLEDGICVVYTTHTTAAIGVTSFWDPNGFEDFHDEVKRLIPTRIDFKHQHDTPQDAAGHIKSTLTGISETFIVDENKLLLGHSQGIYFIEFDGPRNREVYIKVK